MYELRKDYFLNEWVIIATSRFKRPVDTHRPVKRKKRHSCPFCPGNEHLTPPEILRVPAGKNWRIRVFPNKFQAVAYTGTIKESVQKFFNSKTAFGRHEVIVETPKHGQMLCDLTVERIEELLEVYINRIEALRRTKNIMDVYLFKNWGEKAGASLEHSHTQVLALNKVSERKKKELNAFKQLSKNGKCPYCELIEKERKTKRFIFENNSIAVIAPFASKWPFEVMLLPKRHIKRLSELKPEELFDLAFVLKKSLLLLKEKNASFNFFLQETVSRNDFHCYFRILPRISTRGGFEEQTGCIINPVKPEEAAKEYRKKFKKR